VQVNLFNSRNPNGPLVPVTINVEQVDDVVTKDGEVIYVIVLSANVLDYNGKVIEDVIINNISEENLKTAIENALTLIGSQINWGLLEEDTYAPIIVDLEPKNNQTNVSIYSDIYLKLKDPFPASLIDLSSIKFYVNGIDETSRLTIRQIDNEVKLVYTPIRIVNG